MSFEFFGNSGIQYFGQSDLTFRTGDNIVKDDPIDGPCSLYFATDLFISHWVPISLDGDRNLLRVFFGTKDNQLFNLFALDTTIRADRHTHSLRENDIAQELNVIRELRGNNTIDDVYDKIVVLDETKKWINDIYEKSKFSNDSNHNENPIVAYKWLLAFCIHSAREQKNDFLPSINILTDHAAATDTIDSSLILDLGNSRTIGLIVEKDVQTNKYDLKNAAPLKLIDFDQLCKNGISYLSKYENKNHGDEYDYLISSMIRFKKNIFDKYPSTNTFRLPSIVAMGKEAENMHGSILENSSIGLSGPKRYLWSKDQEKLYWKFNDGANISGESLRYLLLDDSDDLLNGELGPGLTNNPVTPTYPKRTMMVFAMIEIIYQAYCQINSIHYRSRVGNRQIKRNLKDIVLSFPTAMPNWERKTYKTQVLKALHVLKNMASITDDKINVVLGSDEASCSQLAFLYGEARKFPGDTENLINILSSSRGSSKIRLASLDIGGGTTDLMISDYSRSNPNIPQDSSMKQKIVYSDGVSKAGDDILKALIYKLVMPNIRKALINNNKVDNLEQYFGPGSSPAHKQMRVDALNRFFIPIAEFYLFRMENQTKISDNDLEEIRSLSILNNYLRKNKLKQISNKCEYLVSNDIFKAEDFEMIIPNLIPSIKNIEKELLNTYKDILATYAVVVNRYKPNFLILAGRTTALPIISETLRKWITISPNRIISLKDYYIGDWYPFSEQGIIKDPKTSVVIGNTIAHLSNKKLMENVNIVTDGEDSDFTLNFIGAVSDGQYKMGNKDLIFDKQSKTTSNTFSLATDISIIYRNIDSQNMLCNLMYTLSLINDDQGRKYQPSQGAILVRLDTSNPKEGLIINNVEGEIEIPGEVSSKRLATKDDLILKEQTLFDEEYYLDNGKFDAFPPL